jgi:tetratricopeptide (TPR) repeat protein
MKVINQRLRKLPLLLQAEERKLNRIKFPRYRQKAAVVVCLFLCWPFLDDVFAASLPSGVQWSFDRQTQEAYELVLNLELDAAHHLIPEPATPQQHYVIALAEALELLITEDGEKFVEFEDRFNERLELKTRKNIPDDLFLQAEIRMQWAFVYIKFGHEFDAALNLRQAYQTIQVIKEKFPEFEAINKTSGLLAVVIGSVPQKYNWVLNLLNMEGSTQTGINELEVIRKSASPFSIEANLLLALIQGFLLQQLDEGLRDVNKVIAMYPNNRLALFLAAALYKKNAQGEEALSMLDTLDRKTNGILLHLAAYIRAEVSLYKGDYIKAISAYRSFISNYQGINGIKDAHYKIGLCYWLNGNVNDAYTTFRLAKSVGKEASEADKHAARSLADDELPHVALTKARYATDGGYYEKANALLDSLQPPDLPTERDQVEFHYRKARLYHKTGDLRSAKRSYQQTIDLSGNQPWYYAPNACLQLGYIYWAEGDGPLAKDYFNRALSYNKHEYKNSIDSKAKSAIAQMRRK